MNPRELNEQTRLRRLDDDLDDLEDLEDLEDDDILLEDLMSLILSDDYSAEEAFQALIYLKQS